MTLLRNFCIVTFSAVVTIAACDDGRVFAQSQPLTQTERKQEDIDLDTQLYLLIGTNQETQDKLPAALDAVIKHLRASLPFKNYRLAATLINRVKNDGHLNLKWIGGPLLSSGPTSSAETPSFNEFRVNLVRLTRDDQGLGRIRMEGFSFGARIPIQVALASAAPPSTTINYESTGLNTDISMREAEPVVVGTLNVGPSGDAIILVMSAKKATR